MPYAPDKREYRYFEAIDLDLSAQGGDSCVVEGYATTFNDPYDFGMGTKECIDRHALDAADMTDVIFQYDHEGLVLARQRNGSLTITPDERGLHVRADLSGSEAGRQLYESIKAGLIDRMSWGFTIADGGWEFDKDTRTATITKVDKVFDVSAVSIPANEGTEIKARSYLDGVIEAEQQELLLREKEREQRERLALLLDIR